ncbi:DAK2 domain-containing protein [Egicoccus halophilus]|uniref:Dihydroxyacetone kinase n=1 Tax=Egicoccus halophilus TaxID=1670830 RepID=A0A8J3ETW4_9ACTN|nr:DAK2 domain-containing protein [Egicoccus halophilus]GGI06436.1 dihydroxyacetone kinase [Egicoccus halophilus]
MPDGQGAPLAAAELPALLERVHAALAQRRQAIDDLNVFPVPDGDTGTNMTLTVSSGLEALRAAADARPRDQAAAVVRGAVRGARGNSGVILSQVVRAIVEVVGGERDVGAEHYARALERARSLAYEAVAEPVEGTILTVIGQAAGAARRAVEAGADLVRTSAEVVAATTEAVERTREQLAVLRDAGVVDAGARGFEVLVAAVHGHLTGQDPPLVAEASADRPDHTTCERSYAYAFEVQYLLDTDTDTDTDADTDADADTDTDADDVVARTLRARLERLGDSVVVVAAGGLLNVHVHTDDVGAAIEAGLDHGRPSDIAVTHFGDQIAANRAARPRPALGAVAVLHGDGLSALARRTGAVVVAGRAGDLPSVAEVLDAVAAVDAARVVVLPGHRNAVAAARQAAGVAAAEGGRRLDVVEAACSPPAVLAALAVLDPTGPPDRVLADLYAAADAVRAGEVVDAVRDADTPIGVVRAGQALAVVDGQVVAVADDPLVALEAVCRGLAVGAAEVVTLLVGDGVDGEVRRRAVSVVASAADGELEVIDAGQRPARFWVGVE